MIDDVIRKNIDDFPFNPYVLLMSLVNSAPTEDKKTIDESRIKENF